MNSSTPLYKNEAAGYWEAIYEGHHIVVPISVFDEHLGHHTQHLIEHHGEEPKAAGDAAFFDLIGAEIWNTPNWWHTDAAPGEEGAEDKRCSEPDEVTVCNCPPGFCLRRAVKEQFLHSFKEHWTEEAREEDSFTVHLESSSDDAALERMAAYFYHLYHKAGEGTVQEARYGSIYGQLMSAISRREIATHLETVTAQIDTLMATISLAIGGVIEQFTNTATEKEEGDSDAGTDPTAPTSQL